MILNEGTNLWLKIGIVRAGLTCRCRQAGLGVSRSVLLLRDYPSVVKN